MRKAARRLGLIFGIVVGLLVSALICISLFFNANPYKPKIQAAVAQSTGMDLQIHGDLRFRLFPSARIVLHNVHLGNHGSQLMAAKTIEATPKLFSSLIHQEIRIDKVVLNEPVIHIETTTSSKGQAGQKPGKANSAGEIHSIQINQGELSYLNKSTQKRIKARGLDAHFSDMDWGVQDASKSSMQTMIQSLSFKGAIAVRSLQISGIQATDLKSKIRADHGILKFDSTHVNVFNGTLQGTAQGDFQNKVPRWNLDQTLSQIDIKQVSDTLKDKASGLLDGSIKLSAKGSNSHSVMRSLNGTVSIQGQNLKLSTPIASKFVAILISGPGADIGSSGLGLSEIQKLVMNWSIKDGVAQAKDVALSTPKSTVAARGSIDLRDRKFQNFFIAAVDKAGCSKRQMEIAGDLNSPRPAPHSIGKELAGILGGIRPSSDCDHFYTGSLAQSGNK
jgi:AsmA protein